MKKIGEGYYYHVYDIGNGRVLKKQKSKFRCFLYILFSNFFKKNSYTIYQSAQQNIQSMSATYQSVLAHVSDTALLGNPTFLNGIDYEQDKVVVARDILKHASIEESKKVIDQYVLLVHECWKYGFNENVFNFHCNAGLNQEGKLVLIDFNEVSFDKVACIPVIQEKRFLERWAYKVLSPELKAYYKEKMEQEVTVENLEKYWGMYKK